MTWAACKDVATGLIEALSLPRDAHQADTDGTAIVEPDADGRTRLTRAAERLGLSARA
jgi:hypothetical protein